MDFAKLSPEQKQYALAIADKAREMGVDPDLALAIAARESSFNPKKYDVSHTTSAINEPAINTGDFELLWVAFSFVATVPMACSSFNLPRLGTCALLI